MNRLTDDHLTAIALLKAAGFDENYIRVFATQVLIDSGITKEDQLQQVFQRSLPPRLVAHVSEDESAWISEQIRKHQGELVKVEPYTGSSVFDPWELAPSD